MRIAANTGFLWKDRSFLERIANAGRAGFDAVEFHDEAQGHDLQDVRAALREAGLPLLGLNARMGDTAGRAAIPGEEAAARDDAERAVETARALGGTAVHVLAGKVEPGEDTEATYLGNLAHAARLAEPHGLTVLIEPLSAKAMPGYFLSTVAQAADLIERSGASNVRIMFDVFHVHQAHGDGGPSILDCFAAHAETVGHVQIAHPETRHEPPTDGPLALGAMVQGLRTRGYEGALGAEYVPARAVEDGLGWMASLRG